LVIYLPYNVPKILALGLCAIVLSATFEFHFIIRPDCVPTVKECWKAIADALGLNVAEVIAN